MLAIYAHCCDNLTDSVAVATCSLFAIAALPLRCEAVTGLHVSVITHYAVVLFVLRFIGTIGLPTDTCVCCTNLKVDGDTANLIVNIELCNRTCTVCCVTNTKLVCSCRYRGEFVGEVVFANCKELVAEVVATPSVGACVEYVCTSIY